MKSTSADIIAALKKEILLRQGLAPTCSDTRDQAGLGLISDAFPHQHFPLAAIHEFNCVTREEFTATAGFISALLSGLLKNGGVCIWITPRQWIYPPALASFGIMPQQIIFLHVKKETQALWAMEEALKTEGLAAVVGEIRELSFIESRRFQLAVEQTRVTGFLVRDNPRNLATASVSRWKISQRASQLPNQLPGLGFPRWEVALQKIRNGKPGSWEMEWREGRLQFTTHRQASLTPLRKVG